MFRNNAPRIRRICDKLGSVVLQILFLTSASVANHGGRCLEDIVSAGDGKVVLYDIVVSLPIRKLFALGPHKKLWIVPETPAIQRQTVFFHSFFARGRADIGEGSTCKFSYSDDSEAGKDGFGDLQVNAVSSMDFLQDPIENINVAYCDIPALVYSHLVQNKHVKVSLIFDPLVEGYQDIIVDDMPVCIPKGNRPEVAFVSLCCIIRNEARYLVEWIEYSRMIGIEHFFLYDHNSTDETLDILGPYISAGIVTWHNWSFPGYPQREAHSHCTHRYAHTTTWLGLVDVDEFIVPVKVDSIVPILQAYAADHAVLRLSAAMFGTSGHVQRPPGLVIASYTARNVTTRWPHNPQHKVLFRPGGGYVYMPSIHAVDLSTPSTLQVIRALQV